MKKHSLTCPDCGRRLLFTPSDAAVLLASRSGSGASKRRGDSKYYSAMKKAYWAKVKKAK